MPEREPYEGDLHSVGELTSPPLAANEPGPSRGVSPVGFVASEPSETTWESGTASRTRPELPDGVNAADLYNKREHVYTQEEHTQAWTSAAKMVETYSDSMIERWNKEIDTYLVFSGLFSAILTAFNVQSYLLLQPAAPDPSIAILQQISFQLSSFSIDPPFVNSTQPPNTDRTNANTAPPPVPRWAVLLNALWFSGLILSLTSASVGIMVKQWLNEYNSAVSGTSRSIARVRQYRLNNLRIWHVEDIVGIIPILLQLALALFLSGLLILLWNLHDTVAAIASALVGLLAVFIVITSLLPLVDHKCSYLILQVRALNSVWQPKRLTYWVCISTSMFCRAIASFFRTLESNNLPSWDSRLHLSCVWFPQALRYIIQGTRSAFHYLGQAIRRPDFWKERKQTWQGRERSHINALVHDLEIQTLVEAYSSTLHPDALSAAAVCLMGLAPWYVIEYFRRLHTCAREHFGAAADSWDGPLGWGNQHQLLWLQVILCVIREAGSLSADEAASLCVYFRSGSWPSSMQAADTEWAISICNTLLDYLESGRGTQLIHASWIRNTRSSLTRSAMHHKVPLINAQLMAVTWEYREVRLRQLHLTEASADEAIAAHTSYLQNVNHFLVCATEASKSPLPSETLETVHTYVRDVLTEVVHTLLELFTEHKAKTTLDATYLASVLWSLRALDDALVAECIPDDLVPEVLRLADILAIFSDYCDNIWVGHIWEHTRVLKANIIRIKCKAVTSIHLEMSPTIPSTTETAASARISVPPSVPAARLHTSTASPSDAARDHVIIPHDQQAAPSGVASP